MSATGTMPASADSLASISHVIQQKERELHEYHDLRCSQLETLVGERDNLLLESSKRFDQLRGDFEYNLSLIGARDAELDRLESELSSSKEEAEGLRAERGRLLVQIDALERRGAEAARRAEQDRQQQQRILCELQEGIEAMRWAAEEETRAAQTEVQQLRTDVRHAHLLREEALDAQRGDLTSSFEGLLRQTEDGFASKEREVGQQVARLDERMEQLHSENARVRQEAQASQRRAEGLAEELAGREEARQKAQWALDDERASRQIAEDALQHKLQQATLELSAARENAATDLGALQMRVGRAADMLGNEREARAAAEARLEEVRAEARTDLQALEGRLCEAQAQQGRFQRELAQLKEERDEAEGSGGAARVEADGLQLQLAQIEVDYCQAAQELKETRQSLRVREGEATAAMQALQDLRCRVDEREGAARQGLTEQMVQAATEHAAQMAGARRALEAGLAQQRAELAQQAEAGQTSMQQRHEGEMLAAQRRLADLASEAEMRKEALAAKGRELEEERAEGAALRLRLRLQEAQGQMLQHARLDPHFQTGVGLGMGLGGTE
ncbi:hypothetical protein B484DRAFT_430471, partial [Ochromonadaceae sp. CCMP2298]